MVRSLRRASLRFRVLEVGWVGRSGEGGGLGAGFSSGERGLAIVIHPGSISDNCISTT